MEIRKGLFAFVLGLMLTSCAQTEKPNVIMIVADDLGWMDVSYNGSKFYETPNIDQLASESMLFTDGYAGAPVCSPSRVSLLTGRYTVRTGITDWIMGYQANLNKDQLSEYAMIAPSNTYNLPISETTIGTAMRENGYRTCFVGKWHVAHDSLYFPHRHGFDMNIGGWLKGSPNGNSREGMAYYTPYNNPFLSDGPEGEYLTDRLVDESIQWIGEVAEPFFLMLSFYAVHTPVQPKPERVKKYVEKAKIMGLDSLDTFSTDSDWYNESPNPRWHWKERQVQSDAEYAALVEILDENIGRLIDGLKEQGLYDNTIICFTSDNGGLSTAEGSPTSNAPLRAGKGWMYEGGIREPFLIRIPGKSKAGSVSDVPVHGVDFFPTIIDACGITSEKYRGLDGESLLPLMEGRRLQRDALYWHYPHYGGKGDAPSSAIREGDFKLIEFFETGEVELYNLRNDISETRNLVDEYPEVASRMLNKLQAWRLSTGAELPIINPDYKYGQSGNQE